MSKSSDGRRNSTFPPRRRVEPETRADLRYGLDQRRAPSPPPDDDDGRPSAADYFRDLTEPAPRTGPASGVDAPFDFQHSPLQPSGAGARGVRPVAPPPPSAPPNAQLAAAEPRLGRSLAIDDDRDDPITLSVPVRANRKSAESANAPIVPAGSVTGRSLTLVIAIMGFLACLTAGAVYLMHQSANAWLRDIASEITVQIEAREKIDIEQRLAEVAEYLGRLPGITAVKPLSREVSVGLLSPWLGSAEGIGTLPVPRLIAVEIEGLEKGKIDAIREDLSQRFPGTALDDHRYWIGQIKTVTRSFELGGVSILLLVAAATTAIIVSATQSAMASNRGIVEVLHFVGATDRFIARQFQRHFLLTGIRAGVIGAVLAGLVFLAMPVAMDLLGGASSASVIELQHLIGAGSLDPIGYSWLAVVVVVIAGLCMLTSRIGVYRILHSQH